MKPRTSIWRWIRRVLAIAVPVALAGIVYGWVRFSSYQADIPPPAPLPATNGFDDFVAAGKLIASHKDAKSLFTGVTFPAIDFERKVVSSNGAALARLRAGLAKPCVVPAQRSINAEFPYLADFRELGRLLRAQSAVRRAEGRHAAAFDCALDAIALGHAVMHGGNLMHGLVGLSIMANAQEAAVPLVDGLTAAESESAARRLGDLIHSEPTARDILSEERAFVLESIRKIDTPSELSGSGVASQVNLPAVNSWAAMRGQGIEELDAIFRQVQGNLSRPLRLWPPVREAHSLVGALFSDVFSLRRFVESLEEGQVRERLLLIALKVRTYRLAHGKLPDRLDQLGLDPLLHADPYLGPPIVYRPAGGDYLLYSVGPDGIDDDGQPADERHRDPLKGDLGLLLFMGRDANQPPPHNFRQVPHMRRVEGAP